MTIGDQEVDFFEESLVTIFQEVVVSHGEPGQSFTYTSARHGPLTVVLMEPEYDDIRLFSHFVWSAALYICSLLENGLVIVKDKMVLELGAGAGLPGLLAALDGAKRVSTRVFELTSGHFVRLPLQKTYNGA